jgi:intein/homing endonuclease
LPKHIIGRAVFCLDGNTIIKTIDGDKKLVDIVDKEIKVISIDNKGNSIISDTCKVEPTIKTDKEYEIELEDGSIVKCTENHKFLLTNGTYKEAKDLTIDDEIMEFNPYGYIYKTTNLRMKIKSIKINTLDTPKQFYDVVEAAPLHNFLIKTNSNYIVSHNCSFEDEVSFQPNQDVDIQKKKAKELISSVDARMKSRFMKGEYLPTLNILASSKRTDQSFLESYIDTKKRNESKNTLVIDEPQWVIRTDKDSPNKFCVAVGNKFLNSEVLPLSVTEKDLQIYRDKGFSILKVPMGYYENFLDDIDIALTDIAGISTSNTTKYIAGFK